MLDDHAIKLYKSGKSIREVCSEVNSYPSEFYRFLKKNNVPIRSKSEVQKQALASGKQKHPTKGKVRKEDVRLKISQSLGDYWENLPDKEKEYYAALSKERWDNRTDKEKRDFQKSGVKAIRKAAEEGSKMEFFVIDKIKKAGFNTYHHKKKFLANVDLEVDILIPEIKVVVEVDGPSHQLPIWGDDAFAKRQSLDMEKNGLLLQNGYVIIRLKFNTNKISLYNKTKGVNEVIELLNSIKEKFPPKTKRYYEIIM